MPVKKAILPPGMQKALTVFDLIVTTSHYHSFARGFHFSTNGSISRAIRRKRTFCG